MMLSLVSAKLTGNLAGGTGRQAMAATRKLPSEDVLGRLAGAGMSNKEIGEKYGTTDEAVRQAMVKYGIRSGPVRPSHAKYLPWRIRADHVGDVLARRLRAYSKRQQGWPLSETESRLLDEWLKYMDGDNPYRLPASVHYDRSRGFWLEPRQDGDRDYISPPT